MLPTVFGDLEAGEVHVMIDSSSVLHIAGQLPARQSMAISQMFTHSCHFRCALIGHCIIASNYMSCPVELKHALVKKLLVELTDLPTRHISNIQQ